MTFLISSLAFFFGSSPCPGDRTITLPDESETQKEFGTVRGFCLRISLRFFRSPNGTAA